MKFPEPFNTIIFIVCVWSLGSILYEKIQDFIYLKKKENEKNA